MKEVLQPGKGGQNNDEPNLSGDGIRWGWLMIASGSALAIGFLWIVIGKNAFHG